MRVERAFRAAAVVLVAFCAAAAAAASSDPPPPDGVEAAKVVEAFELGTLGIDLRYRFEFVDSDSFDKKAYASTLRGALAYETGSLSGFSAGVVVETVTAIGNDGLYNNAGAGSLWNGVTDRPVVADPAEVEIDRAWIGYSGGTGLDIRLGRFAYMLDNQRFVGIAPWTAAPLPSARRRSFEQATPTSVRSNTTTALLRPSTPTCCTCRAPSGRAVSPHTDT